HEEMMATRGSYFESSSSQRLTADIGQIEASFGWQHGWRVTRARPGCPTGHGIDEFSEIRDGTNRAGRDEPRIIRIVMGHDHRTITECIDEGNDARNRPDRSVEAELADRCQTVDGCGVEDSPSDQNSDSDGEIEATADLPEQ